MSWELQGEVTSASDVDALVADPTEQPTADEAKQVQSVATALKALLADGAFDGPRIFVRAGGSAGGEAHDMLTLTIDTSPAPLPLPSMPEPEPVVGTPAETVIPEGEDRWTMAAKAAEEREAALSASRSAAAPVEVPEIVPEPESADETAPEVEVASDVEAT